MTDSEFIEAAKSLVQYNQETGAFTWKVNRQGSAKAGDKAGYIRPDGYIKIKIKQRGIWAHRLAWAFVYGVMPSGLIDHINGDPSDNRIENLRNVDAKTNSENERKGRRRKLKGFLLGAHWSESWSRWKSSISSGGTTTHLGWFDTEEQAHRAYVQAKRLHHAGCTI
jgi:hypothetical protein